jgi:hypothetical protein
VSRIDQRLSVAVWVLENLGQPSRVKDPISQTVLNIYVKDGYGGLVAQDILLVFKENSFKHQAQKPMFWLANAFPVKNDLYAFYFAS